MKLPWKNDDKDIPQVEVEFERSAEAEPKQSEERDPVDRERYYGGEPLLEKPAEVDAERETAEWERRYGSEESRNKLGYDGS